MAVPATPEVEIKSQPASTEQPKGVEATKPDETGKDTAPDPETNKPVDYKAELERAQKRIEQAEHKIVELKRDNKKAPEPAADDETQYTTAEELTKRIEAKVEAKYKADIEEREAKLRADFRADVIAEELGSLS